MIKNVLSIDIDFVFTDMNKYNDKINSELTPEQSWQIIRWITGQNEFKPCAKSLNFILKIIGQFCKDAAIEQIVEHDEIVGVLKKYGCKDTELWNIDYHHDINYKPVLSDKVDLSNWVTHARHQGLIKKYTWIMQDDSKFPISSPIRYEYSSYKDLKNDMIPKFDLVVICTSKHYTPPQYWKLNNLLYQFALKDRRYGDFIEIPISKMPKVDLKKFPHYWNNSRGERVFFYDGFFIELNMIGGVPYLSYVNFGNVKNLFGIKYNELIEYIMKLYGVIGFSWDLKGTTAWLKRLSKKYKHKKEWTKDNINYMIISNNIIL